jgi:threonine synthase
VPTGNFGNILAAYVARRMGLPIQRLITGTNRNNAVVRFLETGRLSTEVVVPTITPAMDIQVPSNLERLLFDLLGRDGEAMSNMMSRFTERGELEMDKALLDPVREFVSGRWFDEAAIRQTMADVFGQQALLVDPHTAVGIAAARATRRDPDIPVICVGTAHPAKFPEAVEAATGIHPALPERFANLHELPEKMTVLPPDRVEIEAFVRSSVH